MFSKKLINWYQEFGRRLPWRDTNNPYYIWLSEIILQQTRIEQGRSYYDHFVREYPTIADLAKASEEQVLKSWQGLGYYSRARNLHAAAQYVVDELGGRFPDTYEGILTIKGVGKYTAAAIASFAYRLPYPVIDGNVYRLISRLYGIYTPIGTAQAYKEFEQLLLNLIDRDRLEILPIKPQKVKVKERFFYYIDIRWGNSLLMQQREAGDIWQGLYELPLHETERPIDSMSLKSDICMVLKKWLGSEPSSLTIGPEMKHQLTHRTIVAQFMQANYDTKPNKIPEKMRVVGLEELKTLPISRLIDRYLSKM